jgi:hypothetical protein
MSMSEVYRENVNPILDVVAYDNGEVAMDLGGLRTKVDVHVLVDALIHAKRAADHATDEANHFGSWLDERERQIDAAVDAPIVPKDHLDSDGTFTEDDNGNWQEVAYLDYPDTYEIDSAIRELKDCGPEGCL